MSKVVLGEVRAETLRNERRVGASERGVVPRLLASEGVKRQNPYPGARSCPAPIFVNMCEWSSRTEYMREGHSMSSMGFIYKNRCREYRSSVPATVRPDK